MRKLLLLSFVLGLMAWSAPAAAATTSVQAIGISPATTQLSAPPGGRQSKVFSILNQGDKAFSYSAYVSPYRVIGENYDPSFTVLPGKTDASKWVRLAGPLTGSIPGHQQTSLSYTLNVPAGTAPGGYYAVIFAQTEPKPGAGGVVSHNRVGNILYITVQGPVKTGGKAANQPLPWVTFGSSLPVSLTVSNSGGVHFLTTVSITAKDILGTPVFNANLQHFVLPQTVRKVSATWQNMSPFGLYKIERNAVVAGKRQILPSRWILVVRPWVLIALAVVILVLVFWRRLPRRRSR